MENKKRLIDANVLWKALDEAGLFESGNLRHIAQQTVEEQPTVDAVEVVHGRWIDKTEIHDFYENGKFVTERVDCSACGHIFFHTSALTYNYCPNCGAKMDGDGNG